MGLADALRGFWNPEFDYNAAARAEIVENIKTATKFGDAFIVRFDLLPRYLKLGGKEKDICDILESAFSKGLERELEFAERTKKSNPASSKIANYFARLYEFELKRIRENNLVRWFD